MTVRDDSSQHLWIGGCVLPDDKERGRHASSLQHIEHVRRRRPGTVVKGQCHGSRRSSGLVPNSRRGADDFSRCRRTCVLCLGLLVGGLDRGGGWIGAVVAWIGAVVAAGAGGSPRTARTTACPTTTASTAINARSTLTRSHRTCSWAWPTDARLAVCVVRPGSGGAATSSYCSCWCPEPCPLPRVAARESPSPANTRRSMNSSADRSLRK